ncbi:MAG: hypothetical protein ACE5ED_05970, partial [Rhodothalassiaceae bacterium]
MTVELDALVVRLSADTRRFREQIADAQTTLGELRAMAEAPRPVLAETLANALDANAVIADSGRRLFAGLERSLERFAATGKLSFSGLRDIALGALSDIARAIFDIPAFGSAAGGFPGGPAGPAFPGGIFSSLFSLLGFAAGGPLSPGRPAIVGEDGPEIVVPRFAGEVVPQRMLGPAARRPVSITINIAGDP